MPSFPRSRDPLPCGKHLLLRPRSGIELQSISPVSRDQVVRGIGECQRLQGNLEMAIFEQSRLVRGAPVQNRLTGLLIPGARGSDIATAVCTPQDQADVRLCLYSHKGLLRTSACDITIKQTGWDQSVTMCTMSLSLVADSVEFTHYII